MESPCFSRPQSTASHLFARTRSFHRPTYKRPGRRRCRRRRAYAPTSNTASHDTHEKINSWVSFCALIWVWGSAWRPSVAGAPLLLTHLTAECWRHTIDANLVVATTFVDFRKAFDCVPHRALLHKLKHKFKIEGNLLSWLTDYLYHRTQVTVINGTRSDELYVSCGIPQGSLLGPCLFILYTNDMPDSVTSGALYLYANDTTIYCIGSTVVKHAAFRTMR